MRPNGADGRRKGFSLVEVVLALGVLSFVVLALMGLFSVGLATDRRAGEQTALASMITQVSNDLRYLRANGGSLPGEYHFDAYAQQVSSGDATAFYRCEASIASVSSLPDVSTNLQQATFLFTWPGGSNTAYATLPPP